MRLLVCGDRRWGKAERDEKGDVIYDTINKAKMERGFLDTVLDKINESPGITVLIEGEAPGADTFARQWAERKGIKVEKFPADWDKHGKAAGPMRNDQMLYEGNPDAVVAFHRSFFESRGTLDMVKKSIKRGLMVVLHPSPATWDQR